MRATQAVLSQGESCARGSRLRFVCVGVCGGAGGARVVYELAGEGV